MRLHTTDPATSMHELLRHCYAHQIARSADLSGDVPMGQHSSWLAGWVSAPNKVTWMEIKFSHDANGH
jgi:hypothetical protein